MDRLKYKDCPHYDSTYNGCDLPPYEIEDSVCLLKNILAVLLNQAEDERDGENWKF